MILKEGVLEELIEVKYGDKKVLRHLMYYAERLKPRRAIQIVAELKHSYDENGVLVSIATGKVTGCENH